MAHSVKNLQHKYKDLSLSSRTHVKKAEQIPTKLHPQPPSLSTFQQQWSLSSLIVSLGRSLAQAQQKCLVSVPQHLKPQLSDLETGSQIICSLSLTHTSRERFTLAVLLALWGTFSFEFLCRVTLCSLDFFTVQWQDSKRERDMRHVMPGILSDLMLYMCKS